MSLQGKIHFQNIADLHAAFELPLPKHALISVIDVQAGSIKARTRGSFTAGFYFIYITENGDAGLPGKEILGRGLSTISLQSPGRKIAFPDSPAQSRLRILMMHPDFLWKSSLDKTIKQLSFFHYNTAEVLLLKEDFKASLIFLMEETCRVCTSTIDRLTQNGIIEKLSAAFINIKEEYRRQFLNEQSKLQDLTQ